MECGEQCVIPGGITMMPELCADNCGTVSIQEKVSLFIQIQKPVRHFHFISMLFSIVHFHCKFSSILPA